ncbi:MAG: hypothetical protein V3S68_06905 [Dehalococcoidia bacterium]
MKPFFLRVAVFLLIALVIYGFQSVDQNAPSRVESGQVVPVPETK